MNLSHIFQKEMPTDDNNIFLLNSPKTIKWKKFFMVTGLSIDQKTETDVIVPDLNARHSLSDMIRS